MDLYQMIAERHEDFGTDQFATSSLIDELRHRDLSEAAIAALREIIEESNFADRD